MEAVGSVVKSDGNEASADGVTSSPQQGGYQQEFRVGWSLG